jgi:hypothetical protein
MASNLTGAAADYQSMIDQMNQAKAQAAAPIPDEYQQAANLYAPGGSYGAGAETRIKQAEQAGVAGTMNQLVGAGMSSGALAAGVRSKYGQEAETQMKEVDDTRTERYATALNTIAAARGARGVAMTNAYQTTASLIAQWKAPLEAETLRAKDQLENTIVAGQMGLQTAMANNQAAANRQAAAESYGAAQQTAQNQWQSSENALYKKSQDETSS